MSVLLPLPDAPTRAMNSPRLDEQVEALERDDLEVGDLVDLDQVVADDQRPIAEARGAARRARSSAPAGRRSR